MTERAGIEALVKFYSPEQGGKTVLPDLSSGGYRPHFVLQDDPAATYLGVELIKCTDDFRHDVEAQVIVRLPYERGD